MSASRAIGVDLSDGTIKVVELVRRGRRAVLRAAWRAEPAAGPDPRAAALEAAAALLRRIRPSPSTRVVLSAPCEGLTSRTFRVPVLDAARTAELVEYELLSELQVPAEDVVLRHLVRRAPVEQPVHAYALRRGPLEEFRAGLSARRVPWDEVETPGFALASFVEAELPAARDRVLLGVGREATELVLLTEDGLWTRHLPLGLAHADPETLARRLGDEVGAAVAFLLPVDRGFRPAQLVLTEEGAGDARLTGALKRALGLPVTRVTALERLRSVPRPRLVDTSEEQALSSAKAIGLALGGLGLARFRCPVLDGEPQRESLRRVPLVAAAVIASSLALVGIGELARARTAQLNATLPISRQGELQDRARMQEQIAGEVGSAEARAMALLEPGRRRAAVLQPRRALAALAPLADERGDATLHVDTLWLSAGDARGGGMLSLTLLTDPSLDEGFADRVERALHTEFRDVRVNGPEAAPQAGLTRWVVEVALP